MQRSFGHALLLLAASCAVLKAQEFEVASIRVHPPPLRTIMGFNMSGPRMTLEGYNLALLVTEAYGLNGRWQYSLPKGAGLDDQLEIYYDVVARAPGDGAHSRAEFRVMLQALLADRFHLTVHRETRQTPVYALVTEKNGPKLKTATGDAECATTVGVVTGGQSYTFSGCGMDSLASVLGQGLVDRPVIEQTGLNGKYDFRITLTPAFMRRNQADMEELSPYTAVQDLGLKLTAQTAPMEIIVVDRFERPSTN